MSDTPTDTYPLEIAPPGELAGMCRSIGPLREELNRLLNQEKATSLAIESLRQAIRGRCVALAASKPVTPVDVLALTAHSLELLTLVALACERGFPRSEISIWTLFLQTALESLLARAEREAGANATELGLLNHFVPVGLIFGFADVNNPSEEN